VTVIDGATGASLLLTMLKTPVAHGVQVPQHAQKHPQQVNGINIAAMHCTMQTAPNLSCPGLVFRSLNALAAYGSYLPQQPPKHMQHGMQQIASAVIKAQALSVLPQVTSSTVERLTSLATGGDCLASEATTDISTLGWEAGRCGTSLVASLVGGRHIQLGLQGLKVDVISIGYIKSQC
jgi:hypothetical protein